MNLNKLLLPAIACLIIDVAVVWVILSLCSCAPSVYVPANYEPMQYTTYAAEPFVRTHFGDLYNEIDTVHVLSITIKSGVVIAHTVEHGKIEIRYPDRLERLCLN